MRSVRRQIPTTQHPSLLETLSGAEHVNVLRTFFFCSKSVKASSRDLFQTSRTPTLGDMWRHHTDLLSSLPLTARRNNAYALRSVT